VYKTGNSPCFDTAQSVHFEHGPGNGYGGQIMLYYALVFFIIAIIAAAFGFGGIAAGAASIAKILFFIFIVVFLVTLVMGLIRR
jgi:uncharacterized membrane protein YtjA (UPF0391 family)